MAHTKGPWRCRVSEGGSGLTTDILGEGNYTVASDVDNKDDAALLTAAPELLDVCKSVLRSITEDLSPDSTLEGCAMILQMVIAKAERGGEMKKGDMRARIDMMGQKIHKLTFLEYTGRSDWLVLCDCGNTKIVSAFSVKKGTTTSCGCVHKKMLSERTRKHGMTRNKTRTYFIWVAMRQRCRNSKSKDYKDYGGRGIAICERWNDYMNFLADMGECPDRRSIHRINNDGNYEPGNCTWATNIEQASHTRKSTYLTHNGKTRTAAEWARLLNIDARIISDRLSRGWPHEKILTLPKGQKGNRYVNNTDI